MTTRALRHLVQDLILGLLFAALVPLAMSQANVRGQWSTLPYTMPINPVHAALLANGKILVVAGSGNCAPAQSGCPAGAPYGPSNGSGALLLDPVTGSITQFSLSWDMFCNDMVLLPDGRVFINGGTIQYDPFYGALSSAVFDPSTNTFTNVQNMAHGRWYPTLTTLGDGRVMTFSGLLETGSTNTAVEIYTVGVGWSTQYFAPWTPPLYPRMHLLPSGQVFYSGPSTSSALFNPVGNSWTQNVATTNYCCTRTYGSSVLLPLTPANNYDPKIIIMGGNSPATNTSEIIDMGAANPGWVSGPNMSQARIEMNAVMLPNGKVLAMGGSVNDEDTSTLSLNADLYDPASNTFSSAGANASQRLYHSVAMLLPDATVWLAGGNPSRGTYNNTIEIYRPAYLFDSSGNAAVRPTISGAPSTISYGNPFTVQTLDAANISSVVLVRTGAVTHAFGSDQRLVGMSFTAGSGSLTVTAPPNGNIAPPGYYMLFLLNTSGVPSYASFIQIGVTAPGVPTNLVANAGSGQIGLGWSGSSGAISYNVKRSTTSGGPYTTVGSAATNSYTDSGLTNGTTYYYVVSAVNGAGESGNSNQASATPQASTAVINYGAGFTAGGLQLNGYATLNGTRLRLTDGGAGEASSAFYTTPVNVQNFTTNFSFQMTNAAADGMTFVIQNNAPTALGGGGGALGYAGMGNSVAVKFDIYNGSGEGTDSTGIYTNGAVPNVPAVDMTSSGVNLLSGDVMNVQLNYNGTTLSLSITDANNPQDTFSTSWPVNIPGTVGANTAYVGFTGGTGGLTAIQDVLSWTYGTVATTVPGVPANVVATAGNGQVGLSWSASSGATSYNVKRSTTTGGPYTTVGSAGTNSYTDTGLTNGTAYYYVVSAVNGAGESGNSSQVNATPQLTVPGVPANVVATAGNGQVGLSWSASNGATTYNVKRSTTSGGPYTTVGGPAANSYTDTGLTNGTTYYYVVSAVNGAGESGNSIQVNATPQANTTVINYGSGFSAGGLQLNGKATLNGTRLRLTDGGTFEASSAFYTTPVNVQNFTTNFSFQMTNAAADGMTFVIQNNAATALGGSGGALGYAGMGNSVAVKFDIYNGSGEGTDSTGMYLNGATPTVPAVDMTSSGVNLLGGDVMNVQLTYNGTTLALTITDASNPEETFNTSWTVNIPGTVGANTAYIGFTGGTGGGTAIQDVLTWTYSTAATTPPGVPANVVATAGNGQVGLSWSASSGASSYNVKRSTTNGGPYTTVGSPTTASYTDTGLTNGTTYYYVVSAVNGAGESGNSSEASATPQPAIPAVPANVVATAGNGQVGLSWTASSGATSYNVKRSTTSGGPYTTVGSPTTASYTDTGLTNGTTYYYVVSAVNATGESGNSSQVNATPLTVPGVPANMVATAGNGQVGLSWTASSGATSYNVKRSTTTGGPYTTVGSPTTGSYTDTGLTNGTTYYYVVSAVNGAGESGNSTQTSATPQPAIPVVPANVVATAGNGQVGLSWTASSGATSYNVKRSTTNGGPYTTVGSPTTASYTDTGLTNGTTYYYVVSAVNAAGESGNSSQVNAAPQQATVNYGGGFSAGGLQLNGKAALNGSRLALDGWGDI